MSDMIVRRQIFDVRIGKRGQVVIPAEVRRSLGLAEGDLLQLTVSDEGQELGLKRIPSDPVERLRRAAARFYEGVDVDAYIDGLREEWER